MGSSLESNARQKFSELNNQGVKKYAKKSRQQIRESVSARREKDVMDVSKDEKLPHSAETKKGPND